MTKDTKTKLEAAIAACAEKAKNASSSVDALHYTGAALNAANALATAPFISGE